MDVNIRSEEKLYIHKSGLSAFKRCPLKFSYMYVHQIEPMESEEQIFGREFHKKARVLNYRLETDVLFSLDTAQARLGYLYSLIPECSLTVEQWLRNYCSVEVERSLNFELDWDMFKPIAQEKYLESDEYGYAGTFDRIDWFDWDSLIIIDYKPTIPKQLSNLRQEMAVYWVLGNAVGPWNEPINHWGAIAYKTAEIIVEPIKEITLRYLKRNTIKMWEAIKNDDFPPKPSEHCVWCMFSHECVHANFEIHEREAGIGEEEDGVEYG